MVSFKRALKSAGKKIKKFFTKPFCSKKKKITEGGNKETQIEQPVNDSSNFVQTNCSIEIAQEETQGSVVIETHSVCKKISEESLSEAPVAQATSTDAIKEEADSGNSVENSERITDDSPKNKEKTIDGSVDDTEQVAVGSSKTNDVPPLGVNATDVVGEEEVLLTCISNEKTEQLRNFISTQYSSEKILNGINEDLVLQIISTICCLSLNNKAKRATSTEEIIHFEVNLNKNTFCFYSSKPAEVATEIHQQNDTTEEDQNNTEETATSQNEVISNDNSISNEEQIISNNSVLNPLIHQLIPSPRKVKPIKDYTMVRMNRRNWRNNPRRKTLTNELNINLKAIKTKI